MSFQILLERLQPGMVDLDSGHHTLEASSLSSERRRYKSTNTLASYPPTLAHTQRWRREILSGSYDSPLDRVNVLDGHTGSASSEPSMARSLTVP